MISWFAFLVIPRKRPHLPVSIVQRAAQHCFVAMKEFEPREYMRFMKAITSSGSELAVSAGGFGASKRSSVNAVTRPAFMRASSVESGLQNRVQPASKRKAAPRTSSARALGRRRKKSVLEDDEGLSVFSRPGGRRLSVMGNVDVDAFLLMVVVEAWPVELRARALRRKHRAATKLASFVRMTRAKAELIQMRKQALRLPMRRLFRAHDTARRDFAE